MTGIERAKAYVDASNNHDLNAVEAMFAHDADYVSSGVGSYKGALAIRQMMDSFFLSVQSLNWKTSNWHFDKDEAWAFDFVMTGKHAKSGELISKSGHERIWVKKDGLISRIEVRT